MLLADGKLPIRQFPWYIAHHTVVVFLIKGMFQADGVYDQLLYQALVVIKLIECSGIILGRVVLQFGENEVYKIVDGRIKRRHFFQVTLVPVDLLAVVQSFFSAAARIDEKLWRNGLVLFLLRCCSFPLLQGCHGAVYLFLWKKRELLGVLLGFLKKLPVIL